MELEPTATLFLSEMMREQSFWELLNPKTQFGARVD